MSSTALRCRVRHYGMHNVMSAKIIDMLPVKEFLRFHDALLALPVKKSYTRKEIRSGQFRMFSTRGLDVYYAPFHFLNKKARVILVGLTPGWTQMERAFWAARHGMAGGLSGAALFRHIELIGSFSGPMRRNLVAMLEGIGLHEHLNICCCRSLFENRKPEHNLAHFTSLVSAPIFQKGGNYRGYGPRLLDVPELKEWVSKNLATEFAKLPKALIIPLGTVANEVLQFLCTQSVERVERDRCLINFPHPSGANGHRIPAFERGCKSWRRQIRRWFR